MILDFVRYESTGPTKTVCPVALEVVVSVTRDVHAIASARVPRDSDPTVEIVLPPRVPTSEVERRS
ncbi:MAG TPA: hypothetical protein VN901_00760, partial [Candidatus Acidoferrales bacterium]|nr:hypothetical protein [Candidatus Acidoferrales bacterium]